MMKWGGVKLYDALVSMMNEYVEIIGQYFSSSDNHKELEPILRLLYEKGLNPSVAFSDDPARDKKLLEDVFPGLRDGVMDSVIFDDDDDEDQSILLLELRDGNQLWCKT
jgi:hypothetical protein